MQSVKAFICSDLEELAKEIDNCAYKNNLEIVSVVSFSKNSALVVFKQKGIE